MKRRIFLTLSILIGLVLLYIIGREVKELAIEYYADNYHVRTTVTPATDAPDQIVLTWSADPKTTQTIQWRTNPNVDDGSAQYHVKTKSSDAAIEVAAQRVTLDDPLLENDTRNARFTAVIHGLQPGTMYSYRVGSKKKNKWSEWTDFITAPEKADNFSFVYLGDPQVGLFFWGGLVRKAYDARPSAAFYVIAGDLVNKGNWRNEWDEFFAAGSAVFSQRPVIPVLGNHDYSTQERPLNYLSVFALPENGPLPMPPEHAYTFQYNNALFIALDSNLDYDTQTAWLEEQLKNATAKWKFAIYHHPAYPSAPHRDNPELRETWGALFDKYHLDIAFQGHDHAYLRTYPMRVGERVESFKDGTIYVVSVSGSKLYDQEEHAYAAVAFAKVPTYQLIDIGTNPDKLEYKSYDMQGAVRDEFTIEK